MRWCDGDHSIFQGLFLGVYKRWSRCIKGGIERLNDLLFSLSLSSLCCAHPTILPRMAPGREPLGTPGRIQAGDASGNSTQYRQTFFHLPCPVVRSRRWATRVARVAFLPGLAPPTGFFAASPHGLSVPNTGKSCLIWMRWCQQGLEFCNLMPEFAKFSLQLSNGWQDEITNSPSGVQPVGDDVLEPHSRFVVDIRKLLSIPRKNLRYTISIYSQMIPPDDTGRWLTHWVWSQNSSIVECLGRVVHFTKSLLWHGISPIRNRFTMPCCMQCSPNSSSYFQNMRHVLSHCPTIMETKS